MRVELLSPAGSFESLKASINAGADAVYLGGQMFGARAFADNLSSEELLNAIDYVHIQDKRLYLTLNTLLKDDEVKKYLHDYLMPLYKQGLDAVIVQDMGVIKFVKKYFPNLPIHASTQMSIMGVYGAKVLEDLGISRVVTARELSLEEISAIRDNTNIEIESFVHGALCYSFSGMCLFSSILGGRSGNRGRCAQPCRLPYSVMQNGKTISKKDEQYVLSPKDICTLQILPEIIDAGVFSLKIEGRMKSTEYTAGVTSIYRKYIDLLLKQGKDNYHVRKDDLNNLLELYSRNGSTTGYYKQHNSRSMITLSKPGYATSRSNQFIVNSDKKKLVDCNIVIAENKPVEIKIYDDFNSVKVFGSIPTQAINKPLTEDIIKKQIAKTGGTDFDFRSIHINLENNLFLTVLELNQLRRTALEKFQLESLKLFKRDIDIKYIEEPINEKIISDCREPEIICYSEELEQFNVIVKIPEVSAVYLDYSCIELTDIEKYVELSHKNNKKLYLALPLIFRKEAVELFSKHIGIINKSNFDGYLIKNIDEYGYFIENAPKEFIFDYSMYALNQEAKSMLYYWNPKRLTLPLELNYKELKARGCEGEEIIVYGYLPMMVTAGCIKKTMNNCNKKCELTYLRDRYNKKIMVKNNCTLCYNTIYNSEPLSLLGVADSVKDLRVKSIRLNFTNEHSDEVNLIVKNFINVYKKNENSIPEIKSFTRGHFKRGIE